MVRCIGSKRIGELIGTGGPPFETRFLVQLLPQTVSRQSISYAQEMEPSITLNPFSASGSELCTK